MAPMGIGDNKKIYNMVKMLRYAGTKSDVKKINHKNNNLFFNINKFTNIRCKVCSQHSR